MTQCTTSGSAVCCPDETFWTPALSAAAGCTACPGGLFGDGSETSCHDYCPTGRYKSASACLACIPGSYRTATSGTAASDCTACAAGKFSAVSRATTSSVCVSCGVGNYSLAGATQCLQCPSGTYQPATERTALSDCLKCDAGRYSTGVGESSSGACGQCPNNTYSGATGASNSGACQACPEFSHSSPASQAISACVCDLGYKGNNGGPCTLCGTGEWCISGTSNPCPAFSRALKQGISRLEDCVCSPGYYGYALLNPTPCTVCPANSYCDGLGANSTQRCPNGKYSLPGQSVSGACFCPPFASTGVGAANMDMCACDKNYLQVPNATSPIAGFSCAPCPAGQICYNGTNSSCPPFSSPPVGKPVQTFMDCLCDPGYYNATTQTETDLCQSCKENYYCLGKGLDIKKCPDDLQLSPVPSTNVSACYCKSGWYGIGNVTCQVCPADKYCTLGDAWSCSQNSASVQGAASVSKCTCNAGYYGPNGGSCSDCPSGTYNTMQGCEYCNSKVSGDCLKCEVGTYSNASARTSKCYLCPPGTYLETTGHTLVEQCSACPAGTYQTGWGMSSAANCTQCDFGTFSNISARTTPCDSLCSVGTYLDVKGMRLISDCISCPVGTYSMKFGNPSLSYCTPCQEGTYQDEARSGFCKDCPAGTYLNLAGMSNVSQCISCPVGTYQAGLAKTSLDECLPCWAGTQQPAVRKSTCDPCPLNTFEPGAGSAACGLCPANSSTVSIAGGASVAACVCKGDLLLDVAAAPTPTCRTTKCAPGAYLDQTANPIVVTGANMARSCGALSNQACPTNDALGILYPFRESGDGANDGVKLTYDLDANGELVNDYSFRLGQMTNPWWVIDLGSIRLITGGKIWNQYYGCYDSTLEVSALLSCGKFLMKFQIWVGNDHTDYLKNTKCYEDGSPGSIELNTKAANYSKAFSCSANGRYLFVLLPISSFQLAIGEIEIFGYTMASRFVNQGACISCPIGTYGRASGMLAVGECTKCGAGAYQSGVGMTSAGDCLVCGPGLYQSLLGASSCATCGAGQYQTGSGMAYASNCTLCGPGKYQPAKGAQEEPACAQCGVGAYQTGYGMPSAGNCTQCGAGTFQTGMGMQFAGNCSACGAGKYQSAMGVTGCTQCGRGAYQTGQGMPSAANCSLCGAGKYQELVGQIASAACLECGPGKYQTGSGMPSEAANCSLCRAGTYEASDAPNVCTACPANSNSTGGNWTCQCSGDYAGVISLAGESCSGCTVCDPDHADTTGSCDKVTRVDTVRCACHASYFGSGRTCAPCSACSPHASRTECPVNSTADVSACSCLAGYYGDGRTCTACAGCDAKAKLTTSCPAGTASDISVCSCNAGYYGDGRACTECTACDAHATQTTACAAGSASDVAKCSCNASYYGSGFACSQCRACSPSATQKVECPAGSTSDVANCSCNTGYYGGGFACTQCAACSPYANQTASCPAGSAVDTAACSCIAGYSGTGFSCAPCRTCSPNATQSAYCSAGSTLDTVACSCRPGTYGDGFGCAQCVPCDAHAVQTSTCAAGSTNDTSTCSCNTGYTGTGKVCLLCPAGTWGSSAGMCTPCPRGTYSLDGVCLRCPQGTYQPIEGGISLAACTPCPLLSTTAGIGSDRRTLCLCVAPYVSSITESGGGCAGCSANEYPEVDGSGCKSCPPFTQGPSNSVGIQQCTSNAGYYAVYTRKLFVTVTLPEDEYDPATFEAYIRAAAGGGRDLKIEVEPVR